MQSNSRQEIPGRRGRHFDAGWEFPSACLLQSEGGRISFPVRSSTQSTSRQESSREKPRRLRASSDSSRLRRYESPPPETQARNRTRRIDHRSWRKIQRSWRPQVTELFGCHPNSLEPNRCLPLESAVFRSAWKLHVRLRLLRK